MPGVHPALGLGALPSGVEEALLTYPGLLPSAPALMVEGINSNLAAAQHALVACRLERSEALRRAELVWRLPRLLGGLGGAPG